MVDFSLMRFFLDKKITKNLIYKSTNFNKPYQIFYQQYIKKSLYFNIHFYLGYYKSIVNFSNTKLLNIEAEYIENFKFNILETLTNSGWFREYNDNITEIIEELESIIANN